MQVQAQQVLCLDSCRAMALRNNKTLVASRLQLDMAQYNTKAAKTKYLPHISAVGGYELTSREISLLAKTRRRPFQEPAPMWWVRCKATSRVL